MQSAAQAAPVSNPMLWAGRIISALVVLFMLFDGAIKVMKLGPAVEGTVRLGYPAGLVVPIGIAAFLSAVLYAIPRTAVLGAILLTGYLGSATATQVRVQDAWFWFPIAIGTLAWGGLFLRDERLRWLMLQRS